MKILQAVKRNFELLGFDPKLKPLNHIMLSKIFNSLFALILLWIFLIHEANSSQEYMESIYVIAGCNGIFFSFISTIFIAKKLFSVIDSIEELINERLKSPSSQEIYKKANHLVEKYCEIGNAVVKYVIVPCFILPKAIVSFFNYFTTDLGSDAFSLPIQMWFPFDWKNPAGYLVAIAALTLFGKQPFQHLECFIFFAFGVYMFTVSLVKDMKGELYSINKMTRHRKTRRVMYKKLSEFIRMHNAKRLFISFSDLNEITLTIMFTNCIIAICVAMLLIQIGISHNETDSIVLLEAALFGVWAFILLLFVCELGQRFSNAIAEINVLIIQLDWYLYPVKVRRVLPMVIQSAQEPSVIKCFGNVLCARKQFRKVVKTIYSYFMILREFYK